MKKSLRYLFATLLLIAIIFLITITYMNYKVIPTEVHKIDSINYVKEGNFENFNSLAGDCCNANPEESRVFAAKSKDAYEGDYSLNLTSENQCACISKEIYQFDKSNIYLFLFSYKGERPRICLWTNGDKGCLINQEIEPSSKWKNYANILFFTNKSASASVFFYADSDGTRTVTNLYDDLQVHKLVSITPSLNSEDYKTNEEYVIKTNPTNVVNSICAKQYITAEGKCPVEKLSDDGYYLVRGAPQVNLKFPWPELVLIIIMMLIVIRLLFRKQVIKVEETFEYELKKGLKKFR
ncbi:MAG: hypothetical protein WC979_08145 [Candidatus Pacearchaeota archaeon]|jgi:hypothetical protein